jgi:hypothetical protein
MDNVVQLQCTCGHHMSGHVVHSEHAAARGLCVCKAQLLGAGSKRTALPSQQWGVSKPRTHLRPPGGHPYANATGLINFPPDSTSGPRYRRLSNDGSMHCQAMPGDQTFLFGAVGQPSLREIAPRETWSCALIPAATAHTLIHVGAMSACWASTPYVTSLYLPSSLRNARTQEEACPFM